MFTQHARLSLLCPPSWQLFLFLILMLFFFFYLDMFLCWCQNTAVKLSRQAGDTFNKIQIILDDSVSIFANKSVAQIFLIMFTTQAAKLHGSPTHTRKLRSIVNITKHSGDSLTDTYISQHRQQVKEWTASPSGTEPNRMSPWLTQISGHNVRCQTDHKENLTRSTSSLFPNHKVHSSFT